MRAHVHTHHVHTHHVQERCFHSLVTPRSADAWPLPVAISRKDVFEQVTLLNHRPRSLLAMPCKRADAPRSAGTSSYLVGDVASLSLVPSPREMNM